MLPEALATFTAQPLTATWTPLKTMWLEASFHPRGMSISDRLPPSDSCSALMAIRRLFAQWMRSWQTGVCGMSSRPSGKAPLVDRSGCRSQQLSTTSPSLAGVQVCVSTSARRISIWPHLRVTSSSPDSPSKGRMLQTPPFWPRHISTSSLCRRKTLSQRPTRASVRSGGSSPKLPDRCSTPKDRSLHSKPSVPGKSGRMWPWTQPMKSSSFRSVSPAFRVVPRVGSSISAISHEPLSPSRPSTISAGGGP
mmetsp:Transcript_95967/g.248151  ORF Transcript_95967/g.248151 Transcript_95967/m.248151 type:complete len:251 (-) Transcript_95967:227-979(-)